MNKLFSRPTAIIMLSLFLITACTKTPKSNPTTNEEATSTVSPAEKRAISKSFFKHVEQLDNSSCMNYFGNAPDFLSVNPDGTPGDKKSLSEINAGDLGQMTALSSKLNKESIKVLSQTLVLYTYFATMEFQLKTSEKIKIEHLAETMLFSKTNNHWKAIFYQESTGRATKLK